MFDHLAPAQYKRKPSCITNPSKHYKALCNEDEFSSTFGPVPSKIFTRSNRTSRIDFENPVTVAFREEKELCTISFSLKVTDKDGKEIVKFRGFTAQAKREIAKVKKQRKEDKTNEN